MNETPENRFAPNMERLKAELGRQPPPEPKTSPDDWGRTPALSIQDAQKRVGYANLAQVIKSAIHDSPFWKTMPSGQKEALELIATEIARICVNNPDEEIYWRCIAEWSGMGAAEIEK